MSKLRTFDTFVCEEIPRTIRYNHHRFSYSVILFPFALRNFLPLCEIHFTVNDKNQLTANYYLLIMPKRSLILSEGIINFYTLNHEQIRNFYENSNFLIDHSLKVPNIFEFTYFNLIPLLYMLYRLLFLLCI